MIPGHRYRVIYRTDSQRKDHVVVYDFLNEGHGSYEGGSYFFSARPLAGTQEMPKKWVKSIEEREKTVPISLSRIL